MGKKQQALGKSFEQNLCKWFSSQGYYVIYNEKSVAGSQPCDAIIIKNNVATMVEIKNLENMTGRFDLSRVEYNQLSSYKRFRECHNTNFLIVIRWGSNLYLIDFGVIQFYSKSIDLKKLTPSVENFDEIVAKL